jgi:hypothetical protein
MPGGTTKAPDVKHTGKRGRPSSLTPDTLKLIVAQLLNLGTYEEAALAGGIHPATFERWLKQGSKDYQANKTSDYREFYEAIHTANRNIKTILRGRVLNAKDRNGRPDPKYALAILERRWPEEWGQKIDVRDTSKEPPKKSPREAFIKRMASIESRQAEAEAAIAGLGGVPEDT